MIEPRHVELPFKLHIWQISQLRSFEPTRAMWDWYKSKKESSLSVAFFAPSTVITASPPDWVIRKVHHEAFYSSARASDRLVGCSFRHLKTVVPAIPSSASTASSSEVVTVFFPPDSTRSMADSIFGLDSTVLSMYAEEPAVVLLCVWVIRYFTFCFIFSISCATFCLVSVSGWFISLSISNRNFPSW